MDTLTLRRLLDEFQRDFPLEPRPYAAIADRLGVTEDEVLAALRGLVADGTVSRVGPVFKPNRVGASTLVAMAVEPGDLERAAAAVSAFAEVNHNYEREHAYNLWFVAAATDAAALEGVLRRIEAAAGYPALRLPLVSDYHIDLGFALRWN